jgi:hypothetical protein
MESFQPHYEPGIDSASNRAIVRLKDYVNGKKKSNEKLTKNIEIMAIVSVLVLHPNGYIGMCG